MINGLKVLTTVCARGGSKGVKNKNIRLLAGKPLIYYTLDVIKKSTFIDDYVISTDSEEIIETVEKYGFKIYFKRPEELADDKVSRFEAVKHAVKWMENNFNCLYDIIIDLGVATPLKTEEDLSNALKLFLNGNATNVFSVTFSSRNPYYNMVEVINERVKIVKPIDKKITDRKDAPVVYDMNDGINIWWRDVLFSKEPVFNNKTKIYLMPSERSIDIDTEFDFKLVEFLLKYDR